MPRYYFRVEPDGPVDSEGEELADDAQAMLMAVRIARELARNDPSWGTRCLTVYNEAGRLVDECEIRKAPPPPVLRIVKSED